MDNPVVEIRLFSDVTSENKIQILSAEFSPCSEFWHFAKGDNIFLPKSTTGFHYGDNKKRQNFGMPAYPTFPTAEAVSIIRLKRFHFPVRNGKEWDTLE